MATQIHCCVDIRGFLKDTRFPSGYRNLLVDTEGKYLSPEAARDYFLEALAKGWKVLPAGECDGFSFETGCPGHPISDAAQSPEVG